MEVNIYTLYNVLLTQHNGDDTPQDDTPQDDTPQDDTPKDDTPKDNTPQDYLTNLLCFDCMHM
jgi:hypothetical protein